MSINNAPSISDLITDLMSGKGVTNFSTKLVRCLEISESYRASGYAPKRRCCVFLDRSDIGSTLLAGTKPGKEAVTRTFCLPVAGLDDGYFEATIRIIVIGELGDAQTLLESMKAECEQQLAPMKVRAGQAHASNALRKPVHNDVSPKSEPQRGLSWGMVAASLESKLLFTQIAIYGPEDSTVMITGETGVGKEMVARALHAASNRPGEFVAVNCGALTPSLLESTLFGHARGAFTGANTERKGLFEIAEGGTIFLDEIGEMPLDQQTTLLRVLQERTIRRIGAASEKSINVRVIAATNQDLGARVSQGLFREDLYYRLSVLPLHIAPLRERRDDIEALVYYQLAKISKERQLQLTITDGALEVLKNHTWPGNVRELVNCIERAAVTHKEGWIDLPGITLVPRLQEVPRIAGTDHGPLLNESDFRPGEQTYDQAMLSHERMILQTTLDHCNGNATEAAALLGLPRTTLRRRLSALAIQRNISLMMRPVEPDFNQARTA